MNEYGGWSCARTMSADLPAGSARPATAAELWASRVAARRNEQMPLRYQREPIGTEWTTGSAGNTGDAITAGAAAGKDEDFGRGDSAYDCYYGDPRAAPEPVPRRARRRSMP
jgi:hypothetical protein